MKRAFLTGIYMLVLCNILLAQENIEKTVICKNNSIGFVPQYASIHGVRVDYDRRISDKKNQWIIVSPQFFIATNGDLGDDYKQLLGFGLEVKHRIFLSKYMEEPHGFYFQYGPMVQHFNITDERTFSTEYVENGTHYYTADTKEVVVKLNKYGGNFHVGYQWIIGSKAYFDMYWGAGIRLSYDNFNKGFSPWYNNFWLNKGYSGTLMDGGFRIGFIF